MRGWYTEHLSENWLVRSDPSVHAGGVDAAIPRGWPRTISLVCLAMSLGGGLGVAAPEPSPDPAPLAALALGAEARDRFREALAALKSGDGEAAAREFGDPRWAATPLAEYARLFEAEGQVRAGDPARARAAMRHASDAMAEARLAPAAVFEAATLVSGGDDATAIVLFRRLLERHGHHPEAARARLLLGQALLAEGLTQDAIRTFGDLWLLSPASREADAAARQLRVLADRGLGGAPPTAQERVERAERLLGAGLGDRAKREAEALLADAPPADVGSRALKVVLDASRRAGQPDVAMATVNRALVTLPGARRPPWLLELARLQQRRERDRALATLDRLVREHPKSPEVAEALLLKAQLLADGAKLPEAQGVYGTLAAQYPDVEEGGKALWRLGWLAWFRGAYDEAAQSWTRIFATRGGRAYREAAAYWIARADQLRGEGDTAARRFAEIQDEAPRSYYGILAAQRLGVTPRPSPPLIPLPADPREPLRADAGYARVEALRAVGLDAFADEEMAEMARRAFGDPPVLYALAAAYAQESRYHLALRILRRHFVPMARRGGDPVPRAFWEMFYPLGWRGELTAAAGRAAIDPFLVAAVVREESSFFPQARSPVGARGLMQLMPDTARPMARERRLAFNDGELLDDPGASIELGTAYLATLLRDLGDARLAAAAYNAGPTRAREWWAARRSDDVEVFVEQIPFNETRAFVKRVMLAWDEYRRLYGAAPSPAGSQAGSGLP
jgi:peptidoglycan lytic transglycosylase